MYRYALVRVYYAYNALVASAAQVIHAVALRVHTHTHILQYVYICIQYAAGGDAYNNICVDRVFGESVFSPAWRAAATATAES